MSVNGRGPNKWWQDNFIRHADKIQHGVRKLGEFLDGDAPIANDRAHHAITSFQQSAGWGRHPPASGGHLSDTSWTPTDKSRRKAAEKERKRKALASLPQAGHPTPGGPNPIPGGAAQGGAAYTTKFIKPTDSRFARSSRPASALIPMRMDQLDDAHAALPLHASMHVLSAEPIGTVQ